MGSSERPSGSVSEQETTRMSRFKDVYRRSDAVAEKVAKALPRAAKDSARAVLGLNPKKTVEIWEFNEAGKLVLVKASPNEPIRETEAKQTAGLTAQGNTDGQSTEEAPVPRISVTDAIEPEQAKHVVASHLGEDPENINIQYVPVSDISRPTPSENGTTSNGTTKTIYGEIYDGGAITFTVADQVTDSIIQFREIATTGTFDLSQHHAQINSLQAENS